MDALAPKSPQVPLEKNVSLDIPRNALVLFTGVSGSGKSSLAFGTLYAEAQRRYLESVSPYARRLFHQMAVPEVDEHTEQIGANLCGQAKALQFPGLQRRRAAFKRQVAES
jgi:excinuclease UvrABC ATPase subunit